MPLRVVVTSLVMGALLGCTSRSQTAAIDLSLSDLTLVSDTVLADGHDAARLAVRLVQSAGPARGMRLEVSVDGPGATVTQPAPTDADGAAEAIITSTVPGAKMITAAVLVDGEPLPLARTVQVHFVAPGQRVLRLAVPGGAATAGRPTAVTVTVLDGLGHKAPDFTGTLRLETSDPRATLPSPIMLGSAEAGEATFEGLVLATTGVTTLTVIDGDDATLRSSTDVRVSPGVDVRLSASLSAPACVAGDPEVVTLALSDALGNPWAGYRGVAHITSSDPRAVLPNDVLFSTDATGVADPQLPLLLTTVGTQTLTVTDVPSGAQAQLVVTVTPGSAAALTLAGLPLSVRAGTALDPVVTAVDRFGNTAPSYLGTVQLTSSDTGASLPPPFGFGPANLGTHAFVGGLVLAHPGKTRITVADAQVPGLTATWGPIEVLPRHTSLVLSTDTVTPIAGVAQTVTVQALAEDGAPDASYQGRIHFSADDATAGLPADVSLSAGRAVLPAALVWRAAGGHALVAVDTRDSTVRGDLSVHVQAAAAASLRADGWSATRAAGETQDVSLTLLDAHGNVATSYTGTLALTTDDPRAQVPATVGFGAADAGTRQVTVTLGSAGTHTVSIVDTHDAALAVQLTTQVAAGAASSLRVDGVASPTVAGAANGVTLTTLDAAGNVTPYTGTVRLACTDANAVFTADVVFGPADAGSKHLPLLLETAGVHTVSAAGISQPALRGAQTGIVVQPGAAAALALSGDSAALVAGEVTSVTLRALDVFGNVATDYVGTVHFSATDAQAKLPADYSFVVADAGAKRFTAAVVLETAGTQALHVADMRAASLRADLTGIAVSAGSATRLTVSPATLDATAGLRDALTVTAYDAFGNVAPTYTGTVAFTSTDPAAALPAAAAFAPSDAGKKTLCHGLLLPDGRPRDRHRHRRGDAGRARHQRQHHRAAGGRGAARVGRHADHRHQRPKGRREPHGAGRLRQRRHGLPRHRRVHQHGPHRRAPGPADLPRRGRGRHGDHRRPAHGGHAEPHGHRHCDAGRARHGHGHHRQRLGRGESAGERHRQRRRRRHRRASPCAPSTRAATPRRATRAPCASRAPTRPRRSPTTTPLPPRTPACTCSRARSSSRPSAPRP